MEWSALECIGWQEWSGVHWSPMLGLQALECIGVHWSAGIGVQALECIGVHWSAGIGVQALECIGVQALECIGVHWSAFECRSIPGAQDGAHLLDERKARQGMGSLRWPISGTRGTMRTRAAGLSRRRLT